MNQRDFIYHIIKFLIINYIKYEIQKNIKVSQKNINRKFLEIVRNKSDLAQFNKLKLLKENKKNQSTKDTKNLGIRFLKKFDKYIKKKKATIKFIFQGIKKLN